MSPPKARRSSADEKRAEYGEPLEVKDLESLAAPHGHADAPGDGYSRFRTARLLSRALSPIRRATGYPSPRALRLRRTSWLDGARGVAAVAVYIFHAMGCWASIVPAWHADKDQTSFFQLPLVRSIFVAGGGAVSVFFVLSGYVLTYRCLGMIRKGAANEVYPAVASSVFRRGFRLYLPPVLLTFGEMLMTRRGYAPPLNFSFVAEPTFMGQFWDWVLETNRLVNPIHNFSRAIHGFVSHPKYEPVIWTIPVEFYGSMVCYLLLLALARVSCNSSRMAVVAVLGLLGMALGCWNIFCFAAGMLIADFNLGQDEESDNHSNTIPSTSPPKQQQQQQRPFLWTAAFALCFYIAGFPTLVFKDARTKPMPGFEALRALIPAGLDMEDAARFWWSIAGVGLLLSVSQLRRLRAVFETNLCQYLAKISFALYLVHEWCIVLFGLRLQGLLMGLAGLESGDKGLGYWMVCVVWFGLFTVPVFALAAQVERWIDVPSVKFAKWLEERCLKMYKRLCQ